MYLASADVRDPVSLLGGFIKPRSIRCRALSGRLRDSSHDNQQLCLERMQPAPHAFHARIEGFAVDAENIAVGFLRIIKNQFRFIHKIVPQSLCPYYTNVCLAVKRTVKNIVGNNKKWTMKNQGNFQ